MFNLISTFASASIRVPLGMWGPLETRPSSKKDLIFYSTGNESTHSHDLQDYRVVLACFSTPKKRWLTAAGSSLSLECKHTLVSIKYQSTGRCLPPAKISFFCSFIAIKYDFIPYRISALVEEPCLSLVLLESMYSSFNFIERDTDYKTFWRRDGECMNRQMIITWARIDG